MPWAVIESNANKGSIETAISDWETANTPTSIDQISTTPIGRDRITIQLVYTA